MPLAFLVPTFLVALGALVVPVLVHLRHRERREPVRFPSLMFLRRIPFREVRRQQIHHWPLFLLRVLALGLLVAAFARPFLPTAGGLGSPAGAVGREVVVLLDRSASMGYGDRWERARAAAREAVRELGRDDRGSLILFDAAPAIVAGPTGDQALLRAAVDQAQPGTSSTRYAAALRLARDLLAASELPRRELVVISDFQRSGWRGEAVEPLPEGTAFRAVNVSSASAPNLAVVDADLVQSERDGRPVVTVTARLAAFHLAEPREARVALRVDGRTVQSRDVRLDVGSASVTFDPVPLLDTPQRGTITLTGGDSLPADDEYRFVAARERVVRVVLVSGSRGTFVRRALEISRRPRVEVLARDAIRAGDLAGADVLVLDESDVPGGEVGRRVADYVRSGGGMILVLGASSAVPELLGSVRNTGVRDRLDTPGTIGATRREHPIFAPFREAGVDISGARVYRYHRIAGDSLEVLATYDDGAPALAEFGLGRGRVLVWTSALDNRWSDVPLQPLFLPLVHQMVLYAAGYVEQPASYRVDQVAAVGSEALGSREAVIVVRPSGDRQRRTMGGEPVAVGLEEAGFYELREPGAGGRLLFLVAANVDPAESALATFDPADLGLAAGAAPLSSPADTGGTARSAVSPAVRTAAERERQQSLWWFALGTVALLLGMETFLGNRVSGFVRVSPGPGEVA
jgi:hypothetical protein